MSVAQRATRFGVFDLDLDTGRSVWSPEMESLYGLGAEGFEGHLDDWLKRVHPDDGAAAVEQMEEAAITGHYSADYRIIRPDGEVRWIHSRATVLPRDHWRVGADARGERRYHRA